MRGRTRLLAAAAGGALVLAVLIVVMGRVLAGSSPHASAQSKTTKQLAQQAINDGYDLGGTPAPAFSLKDYTGQTVSLASLRGHPVVLTFFDSVCPHSDCSLMAEYINWTAQRMGVQANDVEWVAISVDPWYDTPATAKAFLQSRQVTLPMRFLLGSLTELTPVWNSYHMQAFKDPKDPTVIEHSTGVYVLDATGKERLYLDEGFDFKALAAYLQIMLTKPGSVPSSTPVAGAGKQADEIVLSQSAGGDVIAFTGSPQKFGTYTFTVEVLDGSGVPVQSANVTMDLTMTSMAMTPLHVTLGPSSPPIPGTYQAQGVLTMLGQWQASVTVQPSGGAPAIHTTFTFTVQH